MDALSLSHLTYCCATITVNFHRLDHPPFPCKSRVLPSRVAGKYQLEDSRRYIRACPTGIRRQVALTYCAERLQTS
jgi:hypothetical protein